MVLSMINTVARCRAELDEQVEQIVASVGNETTTVVVACHNYVLHRVRERLSEMGFECGQVTPYRNSRHARQFTATK